MLSVSFEGKAKDFVILGATADSKVRSSEQQEHQGLMGAREQGDGKRQELVQV
jgi:hypothetical protein